MASIPDGVVSASLVDVRTGQTQQLTTRVESGCHFSERLSFDRHEIGFRVDWTDLESNGDPCLDADFYLPGDSKPLHHMRSHHAHHTAKSLDPDTRQWVYDFEFGELKFQFLLTLTRQGTVSGTWTIAADEASGT